MRPSVRLITVSVPVDDQDFESSIWPDPVEMLNALSVIEFAGRWDYGPKSVHKMGDGAHPNEIIGRWLATGEESMVEMASAGFLITCSRVVSHELVRHRIASYQQESQRFVAYEDEEPDDLFMVPPELSPGQAWTMMSRLMDTKETYLELREAGVSKQLARYVLPNAMRTRIIAYANLREWRHILRLRMHTSAQPEMREIATLIHGKLQRQFGSTLFPDDIAAVRGAR